MNDEFQTPIDHLIPTDGSLNLNKLITSFERIQRRKCALCGIEFDAVGLVAYCDPCGMIRDEVASRPVYKLGETWPSLQAGRVNSMTGKGFDLAAQIAPKMFGNRFAVLAGDRGRGKTQIAVYCAWHRGQQGHRPGIYARAFDACEEIIGAGFDRAMVLRKYQRAAFLVLDECHRLSAKHLPILESISDERYSNERPTILIGNWLTLKGLQFGEQIDGEGLTGIGSSLMSRINEHTANKTSRIVWCRWDSYRNGAAQNKSNKKLDP